MLKERPWFGSWPKYLPREFHLEPRPLYDILSQSAKKFPKRPCIYFLGNMLTYSIVDEYSSRLASGLISEGLKKGERVAILMPNMPQFVISYFAILKAGGIVVPCSPLYKERELEYQLRDSGSSYIIAASDVIRGNDLYASLDACKDKISLKGIFTTSITDFLPGIKKRLAFLAGIKNVRREGTTSITELIKHSDVLKDYSTVDPIEDVALLQYTGGTTGTSKGAMLTHYNLYSNAVMTAMALPLTEDDISLSVLPLFHIYGMTATMNAPLYAGSSIVLLPRFDVKEVLHTIAKMRVTCFCGVPTMYIAINNYPDVKKFNLRSIRACISGGAPLPSAVRKRFIELTGGNLVEGYGLTECSPVTHCNPLHDGIVKDGSIGIPFPSTDAAIVDLDDPSKFLPPGEIGELAIRGPQVMKGYWNRPDETAKVFVNGWLLTGDIAKMDDDGYFYIVDRKKDMIDVSGFKVYPREVEEVLFEHPAVKEAAVIGVKDEYRGEAVKAFVVLKDASKKINESELIEFCSKRLAKYKVPKAIEFVNELPKTLVGKVLRRKLKEEEARSRSS